MRRGFGSLSVFREKELFIFAVIALHRYPKRQANYRDTNRLMLVHSTVKNKVRLIWPEPHRLESRMYYRILVGIW